MAHILRGQTQASTIFGIGGGSAARPKGLFHVRFRSGDVDSLSWSRDFGFLVKSVDQPTIQQKAEEMNQYGKKRQIVTGFSLNPINMTVYDTVDNLAQQMWARYLAYYYGDFSQDESAYGYDIVDYRDQLLGGDTGFGYSPKVSSNDDAKIADSQFYLKAVDIYKVYRGTFVRTTLVNPRIISADPEELDYESMSPMMWRFNIAFEAVVYSNGGAPAAISGDSYLSTVFKDHRLQGDSGEPDENVSTGLFGVGLSLLGGKQSLGRALTGLGLDVLGINRSTVNTVANLGKQTINNFGNLSKNPAQAIAGLGGVLNTFGHLSFAQTSNPSVQIGNRPSSYVSDDNSLGLKVGNQTLFNQPTSAERNFINGGPLTVGSSNFKLS